MEHSKQNFIQKQKPNGQRFRLNWKELLIIPFRLLPHLLLLILVLAVLLGVAFGLSLAPKYETMKAVYAFGQQGQANLLAAEQYVSEKNYAEATKELKLAEENFQKAGMGLEIVGEATLFRSDLVNNQLLVAQDIVSIGYTMSGALAELVQIGDEIISTVQLEETSWQDIDSQKKGEVLAIMTARTNDLKKVQVDFEAVNERLRSLNKRQPLFIFDQLVDPLQQKIPKLQKTYNSLVTMAEILPYFAGYPEEKTYLFIMQNNREMRPSGGFIGTYGILKLENAEISEFFTDNTYNLDQPAESYFNIPSPEPMAKYMDQPRWFFRDGNWWPDFPTSAEKLIWFYAQEGGTEEVDGVIAITPTLIEEVLSVLGEFNVGGLNFNQNNFWEQLQYQVEYGYYKQGISEEDRKDIISDLGQQMIAKLFSLPTSEWPGLFEIVAEQVDEKQVSLYFIDSDFQSVAVENDWAGEVKKFEGDYVMLVDANLAALKTDSVMNRTMNYTINQDKEKIEAEIAVNYQNLGEFSWKTTRYRSYTRLYVPAGSKLISVSSGGQELDIAEEVDTYSEFNKNAYGLFFTVEPKKSKTIIWKYELPAKVESQINAGTYNLMIQKQAGIPKMNLQLDLNFDKKIQDRKDINYKVGKHSLKHVDVIKSDQIYSVWFE